MIKQNIDFSLLPKVSEIQIFHEIGWYQSAEIFSSKDIAQALNGVEEFYNGKVDFTLKSIGALANNEGGDKSIVRNNEFVTLQKKVFQELGWHPVIREIAKLLMNTDKVRLFADSLVTKYPSKNKDEGIVGWHSDKAYWPTCSSNKLLTAWIPLQDCTIEMGPIVYIDGSHRWKQEKLKQFFSFNNQDLDTFKQYLKAEDIPFNLSYMNLKKGQVCFHSCNTVHCSAPNNSDKERVALAVHLQDDANEYQEVFKENGEKIVIGYDKMCSKDKNGNPDYRDTFLFPEI